MLMFPRENPLYANLNTSFTDFGELLRDLADRDLNGYVRISFTGYDAYVFLADGKVTNALERTETGQASGPIAGRGIADRVREKNGSISVYEMSPELASLVSAAAEGEVVYRDLSTAFTSLEKLIAVLRDERHTGHIEVALNRGDGHATIFFLEGEAVDGVVSSEAAHVSGRAAVDAIVQAAASLGATFSVVRAAAPATREASVGERQGSVTRPVDVQTLLGLWQAILAGAERVVDGLSRKGKFLTAFKEVLVQRADSYPFLDPFAAEFDYREGTLSFEGVLPSDFSKGLGDCLSEALGSLAFQLKRSDLETRVRHHLASLGAEHSDFIERYGVDEAREFVA